jgi:hypothetical protein
LLIPDRSRASPGKDRRMCDLPADKERKKKKTTIHYRNTFSPVSPLENEPLP